MRIVDALNRDEPIERHPTDMYVGDLVLSDVWEAHVCDTRPEMMFAKLNDAMHSFGNSTDQNFSIRDVQRAVSVSTADPSRFLSKESVRELKEEERITLQTRHSLMQALEEGHSCVELATYRGEGFLGIEETKLSTMGIMSCNRPTEPLEREKLYDFLQFNMSSAEFIALADEYERLPLQEDVVLDPAIRRLCSVLNTVGFETLASCEGHGLTPPYVALRGDPPEIAELSNLLSSIDRRFFWRLSVGFLKEDADYRKYNLSPEVGSRCERMARFMEYLKLDVDLIGLQLLKHKDAFR